MPVQLGLDHRLAGRDQPGEVQHGVESAARGEHAGRVRDVGLDEGRVRLDRFAEPGDQVVQDDDLVSGVEQQAAGDAADVAGSSGDEQFHDGPFVRLSPA